MIGFNTFVCLEKEMLSTLRHMALFEETRRTPNESNNVDEEIKRTKMIRV